MVTLLKSDRPCPESPWGGKHVALLNLRAEPPSEFDCLVCEARVPLARQVEAEGDAPAPDGVA